MKIGVLFSGGATTAAACADAITEGRLADCKMTLWLTTSTKAGGIAKANERKIPVQILPKSGEFPSPQAFGLAILEQMRNYEVDAIFQLGWMPRTPANLVEAYLYRIFNQHPGALDNDREGRKRPDFGGEGMHGTIVTCATLDYMSEAKVDNPFTESSVHHVTPDENYDAGAVIGWWRIPITPDDDIFTLKKRLLRYEHETVIRAIQDVANGEVTEFYRDELLIPLNNIGIWRKARARAIRLFPHG